MRSILGSEGEVGEKGFTIDKNRSSKKVRTLFFVQQFRLPGAGGGRKSWIYLQTELGSRLERPKEDTQLASHLPVE